MTITKEKETELALALQLLLKLVVDGKGEASITIHATEGLSVTDHEGVVVLNSGSPAMTMRAVLALDKRSRKT